MYMEKPKHLCVRTRIMQNKLSQVFFIRTTAATYRLGKLMFSINSTLAILSMVKSKKYYHEFFHKATTTTYTSLLSPRQRVSIWEPKPYFMKGQSMDGLTQIPPGLDRDEISIDWGTSTRSGTLVFFILSSGWFICSKFHPVFFLRERCYTI